MRALVTGSNGFIGSFLVERLLDKDWKVRCLVRKTSNLRWLEGPDIELAYGEMFDISSLHGAVKNADVVFHLAGVTKGKSEQDYIRGNYQATINMLKACQDSGGASKKFILISSQAAGGPSRDNSPLSEEEATSPISAYGRSKKNGGTGSAGILATTPGYNHTSAKCLRPARHRLFAAVQNSQSRRHSKAGRRQSKNKHHPCSGSRRRHPANSRKRDRKR